MSAAAALTVAALSASAAAQTSGRWLTPGPALWSDPANWQGQVPGDGGTATFGLVPGAASPMVVGLDIDVTLGRLVFDSGLQYQVVGAESGGVPIPTTLTFTGPAAIDVLRSTASTPSLFPLGHIINRPVAGTSGLNVSGSGALSFLEANTFTGDVNINGVTLGFNRGDAALGAAGNAINLNNAGLRSFTLTGVPAVPLVTGRTINLTGSNTFQPSNAMTFNGPITGSGGLTVADGGNVNTLLTGQNTFTGPLSVNTGTAGQVVLAGGGTLATTTVNVAGNFSVQQLGNPQDNRLAAGTTVNAQGGIFALVGGSGAAVTETVGTLNLATGRTDLAMLSQGSSSLIFDLGTIQRQNRSTFSIRGTSASGTGPTQFRAPALAGQLVGGGGTQGSTNVSILPYAFGLEAEQFVATGADANRDNLTLVTVQSDGRLRPLDVGTEYATSLATASASDNVRLFSPASGDRFDIDSATTVNALVVASTTLGTRTIGGEGSLGVTGGLILNAARNNLATLSIEVPLDFGSAEGVFLSGNGGTLSVRRPVSGSGGVTIANGATFALTDTASQSTYTGTTTILQGTVQINGDVLPNQPSPFGQDDSAIVMAPGSIANSNATLLSNIDGLTFARDIVVRDSGGVAILGLTTAADRSLTVTGNILNEGTLSFTGPTDGPTTVDGVISGPGLVTSNGTTQPRVTLNNANTYTGGTNILNGRFIAGHDQAFGTGPIWTSGNASLGARNGDRTLANELILNGTLNVIGDDDLTVTGSVDLGGANNRVLRVSEGVTFTITREVSAGGILTDRPGTLVLAGDNTFTAGIQIGGFTSPNPPEVPQPVNGGTVVLASQTAAGLGGVNVVVGTLATASGATTHDIAGNLTIGDLGTLALDFGSGNDVLNIAGNLILGGTLDVIAAAGFAPGDYDFAFVSGSLTDNGMTVTGLPDGFSASIVTGNGVVSLSVIPEPAAAGLVLVGGMLGLRRRRI